ncbi:hypothetical protein PGH46_15930 [Legionella pneumophila]|nr:hypothetical protein PGH46_15930 [Legionella pneumophila]
MHVAILGAGPMACEYSKVLHSLQIPFTVIGRSQTSIINFQNTTGFTAIAGGYESYFTNHQHSFSHAIIAVGENN